MTRTFTVITTDANAIVGRLHDRMPVILGPQGWAAWLGGVKADRGSIPFDPRTVSVAATKQIEST